MPATPYSGTPVRIRRHIALCRLFYPHNTRAVNESRSFASQAKIAATLNIRCQRTAATQARDNVYRNSAFRPRQFATPRRQRYRLSGYLRSPPRYYGYYFIATFTDSHIASSQATFWRRIRPGAVGPGGCSLGQRAFGGPGPSSPVGWHRDHSHGRRRLRPPAGPATVAIQHAVRPTPVSGSAPFRRPRPPSLLIAAVARSAGRPLGTPASAARRRIATTPPLVPGAAGRRLQHRPCARHAVQLAGPGSACSGPGTARSSRRRHFAPGGVGSAVAARHRAAGSPCTPQAAAVAGLLPAPGRSGAHNGLAPLRLLLAPSSARTRPSSAGAATVRRRTRLHRRSGHPSGPHRPSAPAAGFSHVLHLHRPVGLPSRAPGLGRRHPPASGRRRAPPFRAPVGFAFQSAAFLPA